MKILKNIKKAADWFNEHFRIRWWNLAFMYALTIILLSSMPVPPSAEELIGISLSDTAEHIILYIGFGLVLGIALRHSDTKILRDNSFIWAIAIGVVFAVIDELYQGFTPLRTPDGLDVLADSFGICIAQGLRWFIKMEKNVLHKLF
jgi:VanZ family protein